MADAGLLAVAFAREHGNRFVEELKALLRIPSISTDPERVGDVRRAAEFVAAELRRIGMENVRLIETSTDATAGAPAGVWGLVEARRGSRRCFATGTMMCSRRSRWRSGCRRRLSRRCGMATCMRAGRWMTRGRCGCM